MSSISPAAQVPLCVGEPFVFASAAPQPSTIAAQESMNPIPKLLLSFPVPRVVSLTRLETPWPADNEEDESAAGATRAPSTQAPATNARWGTVELDELAHGMQMSAQQLLLTGSFSRFLQEQLHSEATLEAPVRNASGPSKEVRRVQRAVSTGMQTLLTSMGQQSALLEVPLQRARRDPAAGPGSGASDAATGLRVPLTRVPKSERWARNDEGSSMSLRPRRSAELAGTWAESTSTESLDAVGDGASKPAGRRRRGGDAAATTSDMLLLSDTGYQPRITSSSVISVDGHGNELRSETLGESFAGWVCHEEGTRCVSDVPIERLLRFVASLPLQTHPFAGIPAAQLSAFLLALVEGGCGAAARPGDEISPTRNHGLQLSARGLLCCQCLAHPHFPTDAVAEGLVGHLIDGFARLVREVTARLQEEDLAGAAAAAEESEGRGRRGAETGKRSAAGAACATVRHSTLLPLLEHLRGFVGAFAVLLCNPRLQLVASTDVYRLEELCTQTLFCVTRDCAKAAHLLFCSYIIDGAVHLYRCIWNRLEVERQRTVDTFFQHLPLSEWLAHRTYQVNYDGRAVLPLTAAVLAAAQSTPLSADGADAVNAVLLQRQCTAWANALLQAFLMNHGHAREKAEETLAWTVTVRVAEDLVSLLCVPEWPGADLLLRSLVLSLAHATLSAEVAPCVDTLRPLAIDVIGRVALKLFDAQQFPVSCVIAAEMERLSDAATTSDEAARMALNHVIHTPALLTDSDRQAWQQLCGTPSVRPRDQYLHDVIASLYMAESGLVSNPATSADYAAVWFHVRAARLLTLSCLQEGTDSEWIPSSSLDALVQWKKPGTSSCSTGSSSGGKSNSEAFNWSQACAWTQAIGTQSSRSMLSLRVRYTLVSLLISVFHLKDANGLAVSVSDVVQKKAIGHLARLTSAYPPLHRFLWPIARQCVRDDSARVRESIVPLLLTLVSDAVEDESNNSGAPAGQSLSAELPESITAEVLSSLLHLLNDKSVSVVLRTIAALDAFLTDPAYQCICASPHGASLVSFVQHKLLLLFAAPNAERKHQQEIVQHFLHRWVVLLADSDGSLSGAHTPLARELLTLTLMSAAEFPHDVTDEHPLVLLLRGMQAYVTGHDAAALTSHARRRQRGGCRVEHAQLLHVMRCAAQSLWTRYQCFHSNEDAVSCLAALHALGLARSEWAMPLAEVLVQSLTYPAPATSPLAKAPEALGGALLHICQTLHCILQSPKLPLISLDHLARSLTALLSKYVGPYQQRVIVTSCGALCALITCGAKHRLSKHINVPYLQLCYSLMNTYYSRVRALLPTLATQPQSVAYTQRFLFLLSEFLRMYPGWTQQPPHPALLEDVIGSDGRREASSVPNLLAKGPGIAANTYQLLEDVQESCGSAATRERVAMMALRVIASLCMLDPTRFFYRAEGRIREALTSADPNYQLQGLSLLSDFLKEEDQRIDAASRQLARLDTASLILGARSSRSPSQSSSNSHVRQSSAEQGADAHHAHGDASAKPARRRKKEVSARRLTPKEARTQQNQRTKRKLSTATSASNSRSLATAPAHAEDYNSGMSTWLFQQFHGDVARLGCGSPHVAVRTVCLRLFEQAAQGGLLPPDKYVRVIVALSADVHAPLRQQAIASLVGHCDRHEEVVAAAAGRGVALAFDLHHACGVHLLRSAVLRNSDAMHGDSCRSSSTPSTSVQSIHSALYGILHKRSRDSMITTLLRYFYQESRTTAWSEEHAAQVAVWESPLTAAATVDAASPAGIFGVMHPVLFLSHLTLALSALPFHQDSDVIHVLHQSRIGIDLNGQAALDSLKNGEAARDAGFAVEKWKAVGALLLHYLRRTLMTEYRVTAAKLLRYHSRRGSGAQPASVVGDGGAVLARRDSTDGAAVADLAQSVQELVQRLEPAILASGSEEDAAASQLAWDYVAAELEQALLVESVDDLGRGPAESRVPAAKKAARADKASKVTRRAANKRGRPPQRKRVRSLSSEDSLSSAGDEAEAESVTSFVSTESGSLSPPTVSQRSSAALSPSRASSQSGLNDGDED